MKARHETAAAPLTVPKPGYAWRSGQLLPKLCTAWHSAGAVCDKPRGHKEKEHHARLPRSQDEVIW